MLQPKSGEAGATCRASLLWGYFQATVSRLRFSVDFDVDTPLLFDHRSLNRFCLCLSFFLRDFLFSFSPTIPSVLHSMRSLSLTFVTNAGAGLGVGLEQPSIVDMASNVTRRTIMLFVDVLLPCVLSWWGGGFARRGWQRKHFQFVACCASNGLI